MDDVILTVPEVAGYLRMSKAKVYLLIQRGELPHIKLGRNVRVKKSDLDEWLKIRYQPTLDLLNDVFRHTLIEMNKRQLK